MTDRAALELAARVQKALRAAGLPEIPADEDADLSLFGMDSLMMVLSVGALERELGIRIPADEFSEEAFLRLRSIIDLVKRLGAR